MGIKYDKIFGDIGVIGIGGIYTELLKDFIILSLPFDINILERRLRDLKLYPMLNGFRNRPKVNINLLPENIMKLYELYKKERFEEIEINPTIN
ncbi:acetate--CoA ligase family protein [Candidatus Nanopusillus massiliensis]|uniref:acetate--CoA ligase family protein n=1 Tax=Candidatus Nanopusillus massiliensis TaxID=2897163 RepID=UPI002111BEC4|nr:acetate--CoA ligase family protein [Candidatus Nanopusillus massiliensis]